MTLSTTDLGLTSDGAPEHLEAADLHAPEAAGHVEAAAAAVATPADDPHVRALLAHSASKPSSPKPPAGRVITVLSPKGGAGKTTVATNLAVGIARRAAGLTALVDLDLCFGDVASALLLDPKHGIGQLARAARALDDAAVKMLLTPHPTGLHVLCAPDDPVEGDEVRGGDVVAVLDVLAADMPYVVVDTGAGMDEAALLAVERSTDLVLVGAMDVPSLLGLRKALDVLDRLGMTGARRHLVLNRADSRVGLEVSDVESTIGLPVSVAVPSCRSIPQSVNQGRPIVETDWRSPASRALQELVDVFTEVPSARIGGFGWLRRSGR